MRIPGREDAWSVIQRILFASNARMPRTEFTQTLMVQLQRFSEADELHLYFQDGDRFSHCRLMRSRGKVSCFEPESTTDDGMEDRGGLPGAVRALVDSQGGDAVFSRSDRGSMVAGFARVPSGWWTGQPAPLVAPDAPGSDCQRSVAIIPIKGGVGSSLGASIYMSPVEDFFSRERVDVLESFGDIIGVALVNQRSQSQLRERVKELSCLYGIARIVENPVTSLDDILQGVVRLLPPAWQYPEMAEARILFEGRSYVTRSFSTFHGRQSAPIYVGNAKKGRIEVVYTHKMPDLDEGPFLQEERNLLDTLAQQVSLIIERKQAEIEREELQDQLRHADRLATIGQLAAGVAHELNEPLGNILGFAQLASKVDPQPPQVGRDLQKIVDASLLARDVIKKLMLFARQTPPIKTRVNLNDVVHSGLELLEGRCLKQGVDVRCLTDPHLPQITADAGQLNQVLVNLIVNALQAMPGGGKLSVQTVALDRTVLLKVEDAGVGMPAEVLEKIFLPFYTTKDTDEGTGLGLSVVNGIVTAHGGFIKVRSTPGEGSTFEVHLPVQDVQEE